MSNNIGVTKTRNPAIGHAMVSNVAHVVQTGSVTVGGWQPSSFGASINVKGSASVATTPIRILPNMIIREGASGDDVSEINRFLRRYGYMSEAQFNEMMAFGRLNQFGPATTNAVRAFQGAVNEMAGGLSGISTISVTGRVDRSTWEAMEQRRLSGNDHTRSFVLSETLEDQFWPEQRGRSRGNSTINIRISGDDITITYRPKVYIGHLTSTSQIPFFARRNAAQTFGTAAPIRTATSELFSWYWGRIREGILRWGGEYTIFKSHLSTVRIDIPTTPSDVRAGSVYDADLVLLVDSEGFSMVPTVLFNWHIDRTPFMELNIRSMPELVAERVLRARLNESREPTRGARVAADAANTSARNARIAANDAGEFLSTLERVGDHPAAIAEARRSLNRANERAVYLHNEASRLSAVAHDAEVQLAADEEKLESHTRNNEDIASATRNLAEHEFGHVLGIFDAYDYDAATGFGTLTNSEARIPERALRHDVMFGRIREGEPRRWWAEQRVYSYNIAMALFAFHTNRLQHYGNLGWARDLLGNSIESEFYFRIWPEDLRTNE